MELVWPPTTAVGFKLKPEIVPSPADGGLIVNPAATPLLEAAVIATEIGVATADVVTVNMPEVWPTGIRILAGTAAAALLLERFTWAPPMPAGDDNVTVPVAVPCPPTTSAGA